MLRTKFLKKSRDAFIEIDKKGIQNQLSKYWKAVMYCYMDEIDIALVEIEDCLREKQHWNILSWKAFALKRQGKYKEAIKVADQILKDYPESWVIATKLDALFWSGDLLEWKRISLKYEEKRKKEKLSNQTKLPEENTRTADFGCLTLKTNPGNCSGLYSVLGTFFANLVKGISFPREVVATIF